MPLAWLTPGLSATKNHWRSRMRRPLIALSLAVSAGIGVIPVAEASAATTPSHVEQGSKPSQSTTAPTTSTASSSTAPGSPSYSANASSPTRSPNSVSGASIVQTAMKYLGYPYTATGNSPSTGFSCIGFVSYVYRLNGINLPGDLGGALAFAPRVAFANLQPGDILYFQNTVWAGLSHAAIYIGGGRFVHA